MGNNFGPAPFIVALTFACAAMFAMWSAVANMDVYEKGANNKYKEEIFLKNRAMKTIVVVDGVERDDCTLQRGAKKIYCKPPLTPEKKAQKAREAQKQKAKQNQDK